MEIYSTHGEAGPVLSIPRGVPHLEFRDVEVAFGRHVTAVRGVSLRIEPGEFVFLSGSSGAGKSTLLKLATLQLRPTRGHVFHKGIDLARYSNFAKHRLRRAMGIVTQDYELLPNKTVWENVAYAMRAVGRDAPSVRREVPKILEQVNVGHRADALPHELSGGERQRVAIGRALINRPPLLLADEPTGNLDAQHSWEITELLLRLHAQGTTVVVVSHDDPVIERAGQRVVTLEAGRITSDVPPRIPIETAP